MMAGFFLVFSLICTTAAALPSWLELQGQSLKATRLNHQGGLLLKEGRTLEAKNYFLEALREAPNASEVQINLGLVSLLEKDPDKAQKFYETALRMDSSSWIQFAGHFNLGELFGRQKKIPEALAEYQQALSENPESVETKTNIELLIQQQKQGSSKGEKPNPEDKKGDEKDQDKKDQSKDPKNDPKKDPKDPKEKEGKEYKKNRPQPKKFESKELDQSDVNKILSEIRQQEQRARRDFNKKETKEQPRDKDW